MDHKTFDLIETKADGDTGTFTAYASVFDNVDHVGDRMLRGAFRKTLTEWRKTGDPIPVILSHQHDDPSSIIGEADPRAVYEDDRGLVVQGQLDLENDKARQVHRLMKKRLLKGWSFGYTTPPGGQKRVNGANEINEVNLIEVGPTLKGANAEALLQAVKEHPEIEGKVETFSKPGTADVTPSDRAKLRPLAEHYLSQAHPFTACVRDQVKHGLPEDHAKRRCAVLLDTFDPNRERHSRPKALDIELARYAEEEAKLSAATETDVEHTQPLPQAKTPPDYGDTATGTERYEDLERDLEVAAVDPGPGPVAQRAEPVPELPGDPPSAEETGRYDDLERDLEVAAVDPGPAPEEPVRPEPPSEESPPSPPAEDKSLDELEFEVATGEEFKKFNPRQPRDPHSGEWTNTPSGWRYHQSVGVAGGVGPAPPVTFHPETGRRLRGTPNTKPLESDSEEEIASALEQMGTGEERVINGVKVRATAIGYSDEHGNPIGSGQPSAPGTRAVAARALVRRARARRVGTGGGFGPMPPVVALRSIDEEIADLEVMALELETAVKQDGPAQGGPYNNGGGGSTDGSYSLEACAKRMQALAAEMLSDNPPDVGEVRQRMQGIIDELPGGKDGSYGQKATNAPWDGSASRFTDEQYARSCVLDRAKCGDVGDMSAKQRYSLPIREPGGALNRNAVHAAAARISQVQACGAAIASAKNALRRAYGELGEDAPEAVKEYLGIERYDELEFDLARKGVSGETPERVKVGDVITEDELLGVRDVILKAVWSTAMINDLPDSSFLYVEPGGTKDGEGKTVPRSKRYFPYKDSSGNIDLPHLRNAIARIPQSGLSAALKEKLQSRAQRILAAQGQKKRTEEASAEERNAMPDAHASLVDHIDAVELDLATHGVDLTSPPQVKEAPGPKPSTEELDERYHDLMLQILSGEEQK